MEYYQDSPYTQADPYASPTAAKKPRGPMENTGGISEHDNVIILKEKVMIPVEKYPGYNFVGSILGPQGSILKELQKAVNAKIAIFGKGSMRKDKEAEFLNSEDEKYAHLKEPLHVVIDIKAPRAEAHRRMHFALLEIYKFMTPQQQQQQGQQFEHQGPFGGGGFGGPPRGGFGGRGAPRGGPRGGRGGRGAPRGGRGGY